jgi:hypothetical protein
VLCQGENKLALLGVTKTTKLHDDVFLFGLRGADMVTLHLQTRALARYTSIR